jgi:hypothetical protein
LFNAFEKGSPACRKSEGHALSEEKEVSFTIAFGLFILFIWASDGLTVLLLQNFQANLEAIGHEFAIIIGNVME